MLNKFKAVAWLGALTCCVGLMAQEGSVAESREIAMADAREPLPTPEECAQESGGCGAIGGLRHTNEDGSPYNEGQCDKGASSKRVRQGAAKKALNQ